MSTFIISDLHFDTNSPKFKEIKEDWNETVSEQDHILCLGVFGDIKALEALNGVFIMADYAANRTYTREELKEAGFKNVLERNLYFTNEETNTFFVADSAKKFRKNTEIEDPPRILFLCTEADELGSVIKEDKLSIEGKYWDYIPLNLDEMASVYDNLSDFENMEDFKNEN